MYFSYMHGQVPTDTVGRCTDKHLNHFRYFSVNFSKSGASLWRVRFVWLLGCSVTSHLLSKLWVTRLKKTQQRQRKKDDDGLRIHFENWMRIHIFRKLAAYLWKYFCVFNCLLALLKFGSFVAITLFTNCLSPRTGRKLGKKILKT